MSSRFAVKKGKHIAATYDTREQAVAAAPAIGVDPSKEGVIVELNEEAQRELAAEVAPTRRSGGGNGGGEKPENPPGA